MHLEQAAPEDPQRALRRPAERECPRAGPGGGRHRRRLARSGFPTPPPAPTSVDRSAAASRVGVVHQGPSVGALGAGAKARPGAHVAFGHKPGEGGAGVQRRPTDSRPSSPRAPASARAWGARVPLGQVSPGRPEG